MTDPTALSFPHLIQELMGRSAVEPGHLAVQAGVSPGAVAAALERTSDAVQTWGLFLRVLGCSLVETSLASPRLVALPRPAGPRRTRELEQWRHRRQRAGMDHEALARAEDRLQQRLSTIASDLGGQRLTGHATSLREALRVVAGSIALTAEELAVLAGASLSTCQAALAPTTEDGRLAILHRLISALHGQLQVVPAGGGGITIQPSVPGPWRPEAPRLQRCTLERDEILSRHGQGESLSAIAREAGVSRQRIHQLVREG